MSDEPQPMRRNGDSRPVPDPTVLTTQAVVEAVARAREYTDGRVAYLAAVLDGKNAVIEQRIHDIDRATELLRDRLASTLVDIHADIQRECVHLSDLVNEKFDSVSQQFTERDIRASKQEAAANDALAAALQAAKELVGAQGEASAAAAIKSETSFTKQIDQIGAQIVTGQNALDARITELKERIDRGEGQTQGMQDTRVTVRDEKSAANQGMMLVVGVLGLLLTVAIIVITVILATA